ncbi:hypothetical protein B296_00053847 [Ensete ventricosum]|uniref:Uncharacterized protein n=1 Tax=Ensete ventricosum TaxID=4639 RepID=A0A426X2X0_ENSVE|nr:hypothetical protein B296_00053847 [Ensete ventricosum]
MVGGLSARELNSLELDFLFLMKFKLHVSVSVFESYCRHLEREVSFGGGYQIERSLRRLMCGGEITAEEKERREPNQVAQNHHYAMALLDKMYDAGQVISCMGDKSIDLHDDIRELKVGFGATAVATIEQQAASPQAEVDRLKSDLKEAKW